MGDQSAFFRAKECISQMIPHVVRYVAPAVEQPEDLSSARFRCLLCNIETPIDAEHTQPEMANHSTFCHLHEFSK